MTHFTDAYVERPALDWLAALGWRTGYIPEPLPDTSYAVRESHWKAVLERGLLNAMADLNPGLCVFH